MESLNKLLQEQYNLQGDRRPQSPRSQPYERPRRHRSVEPEYPSWRPQRGFGSPHTVSSSGRRHTSAGTRARPHSGSRGRPADIHIVDQARMNINDSERGGRHHSPLQEKFEREVERRRTDEKRFGELDKRMQQVAVTVPAAPTSATGLSGKVSPSHQRYQSKERASQLQQNNLQTQDGRHSRRVTISTEGDAGYSSSRSSKSNLHQQQKREQSPEGLDSIEPVMREMLEGSHFSPEQGQGSEYNSKSSTPAHERGTADAFSLF
jgi:hypothetical protein